MNTVEYLIEKQHQIDEYRKSAYEKICKKITIDRRIEILKFAINNFSKELRIKDLQVLSDIELVGPIISFWYGESNNNHYYYMCFPYWLTACLKSDETIYTYKEQLSTVEEYIEKFLKGEITDIYPGYRMLNKFEKWLLTS